MFCQQRASDSPMSWVDVGCEPVGVSRSPESHSPRAGRGTRQERIHSLAPEQTAACFLLRTLLGPALSGRACHSPSLVGCLNAHPVGYHCLKEHTL